MILWKLSPETAKIKDEFMLSNAHTNTQCSISWLHITGLPVLLLLNPNVLLQLVDLLGTLKENHNSLRNNILHRNENLQL